MRINRHGAIGMLRENGDALKILVNAANFLEEVDKRMQASVERVLAAEGDVQ